MIDDALAGLAGGAAALPILYALVLVDSVLVVVPGELAVTVFAALSVTQGTPPLAAVIAVAAAAALTGDVACYVIGRRVGTRRWGWMRSARVEGAFGWADERLQTRSASVLFTARFVPFARLAVNLTAGAGRMPLRRYLLFAACAASLWSLYQALLGALIARLLPNAPALAIVVSIVVALILGAGLDALLSLRRRLRAPRPDPRHSCKAGGMSEDIDLGPVRAYRADPQGTPRGGIVLVHEIWGLVPHIRDVADRLAAAGYVVIAPDLLSDIGVTPQVGAELQAATSDPDEEKRTAAQPRLREALAPLRAPDFAITAVTRLSAAVDALAVDPRVKGRIAAMGFCFGGSYTFALAAADSRVRAAVPFSGEAPDAAHIAEIGCPVLAFYGDEDHALVDALPGVRATMTAAGVDFTVVVYPDAGHAFFNDSSPTRYREEAALDAWTRSLAFLSDQWAVVRDGTADGSEPA